VQGSESKIVLVQAGSIETEAPHNRASVLLQATPLLSLTLPPSASSGTVSALQVLAVKMDDAGVLALQADRVSFFTAAGTGYSFVQALPVAHRQTMPRDPRGQLVLNADGASFSAYLPGIACEGTRPNRNNSEPTLRCKESDDPWPLASTSSTGGASREEGRMAFYNAGRNFYTGVVKPGFNYELPAFYDAAELPRANGDALLVTETSGAVEIIEGVSRRPVSGVRDWGSDFAVLRTQCGADPIVLVSSSGEAVRDSLRAYSIPALEAIAVSAPLAVDGSITAITSLNSGSAAVIVRKEDITGSYHDEVLRVSTLCN